MLVKVESRNRTQILRRPQEGQQCEELEMAAKRHKMRKRIQLCAPCASWWLKTPVFHLAAWSVSLNQNASNAVRHFRWREFPIDPPVPGSDWQAVRFSHIFLFLGYLCYFL